MYPTPFVTGGCQQSLTVAAHYDESKVSAVTGLRGNKRLAIHRSGSACSRRSIRPSTVAKMAGEWGVLGVKESARTRSVDGDRLGARDVFDTADDLDVAIVGAGFAGLATALALRHRGFTNIRVFERSKELRYTSQGVLALSKNGQAALDELHPEVLQRVRAAGTPVLKVVSDKLSPTGDLEMSRVVETGEPNFPAEGSVTTAWHALQQALASFLINPPAACDEVISTGKGLLSLDEDDEADCVYLRLDDGTVVRSQVVIACDGTFSAVRRQLFPDDLPLFFGYLNWNALVPTETFGTNAPHPPHAITHTTSAGDPAWGAFVNDCGQGTTFWQVRVTDPEKATAMSGNKGRGGLGLEGVKAQLLELVRYSERLSTAVEATPEADIFERCIVGRQTPPTWLSPGGRVVLIGDAAHGMHPSIGQGANSAFEDVAALVSCIAEEGTALKAALAAYEKNHKPRMDILHRYANLVGVQSLMPEATKSLTPEMMRAMSPWIRERKPAGQAPEDVVAILEQTDLLSIPHVSEIHL